MDTPEAAPVVVEIPTPQIDAAVTEAVVEAQHSEDAAATAVIAAEAAAVAAEVAVEASAIQHEIDEDDKWLREQLSELRNLQTSLQTEQASLREQLSAVQNQMTQFQESIQQILNPPAPEVLPSVEVDPRAAETPAPQNLPVKRFKLI